MLASVSGMEWLHLDVVVGVVVGGLLVAHGAHEVEDGALIEVLLHFELSPLQLPDQFVELLVITIDDCCATFPGVFWNEVWDEDDQPSQVLEAADVLAMLEFLQHLLKLWHLLLV